MSYSNYTGGGRYAGVKRTAAADVSATYIAALETRIENLASTLATQETAIAALESGNGLTEAQAKSIQDLNSAMATFNTTLASYESKAAKIEAKVEGITVTKSGDTVTSVNFASDIAFSEGKGLIFGDATTQTSAVDKTLVNSLASRAGAETSSTQNWITRLNDVEAKTAPWSIDQVNGQDVVRLDAHIYCNVILFSDENGSLSWGGHRATQEDFAGWVTMPSDLTAVERITGRFSYNTSDATLSMDVPLFVSSGVLALYDHNNVSTSALQFKASDGSITTQSSAAVTTVTPAIQHAEAVAALFTVDTNANTITLDSGTTLTTTTLVAGGVSAGQLVFTSNPTTPQTVPYIESSEDLPAGVSYDADSDTYTLTKPLVTEKFYFDNSLGEGVFRMNGKTVSSFLTDTEVTELETVTQLTQLLEKQGTTMVVHADTLKIQPNETTYLAIQAPDDDLMLTINKPYTTYIKDAIHDTQWVDVYQLAPSHFLNDQEGLGTTWPNVTGGFYTVHNTVNNKARFPTSHYRVGQAPAALISDENHFPPGYYTVTLNAGLSPSNYMWEAITRVYQCIPRIKISRLVNGTTEYEYKYFKGYGYQSSAPLDGQTPLVTYGTVTFTNKLAYGNRYIRTNSCFQALTITFSTDEPWYLEYHSELYIRIQPEYCHFSGSLSIQRHGDPHPGWEDSFMSAHSIAEEIVNGANFPEGDP